jgi:hypothetical protein
MNDMELRVNNSSSAPSYLSQTQNFENESVIQFLGKRNDYFGLSCLEADSKKALKLPKKQSFEMEI